MSTHIDKEGKKNPNHQRQEWTKGYYNKQVIKQIIRRYYEQLYPHGFDSLDEMDQFLANYKWPNSPKMK